MYPHKQETRNGHTVYKNEIHWPSTAKSNRPYRTRKSAGSSAEKGTCRRSRSITNEISEEHPEQEKRLLLVAFFEQKNLTNLKESMATKAKLSIQIQSKSKGNDSISLFPAHYACKGVRSLYVLGPLIYS
jgi:hypothetical protein